MTGRQPDRAPRTIDGPVHLGAVQEHPVHVGRQQGDEDPDAGRVQDGLRAAGIGLTIQDIEETIWEVNWPSVSSSCR